MRSDIDGMLIQPGDIVLVRAMVCEGLEADQVQVAIAAAGQVHTLWIPRRCIAFIERRAPFTPS